MRYLRIAISIGLLIGALLIGIAKWRILAIALLSSASYFADFPFWPLWLPLGLLVLGYLGYYLASAAFKIKVSPKHDVMVVAIFASVLVARFAGAAWPALNDVGAQEEVRPPKLLMDRAASRLKAALDQLTSESSTQTYPSDPAELEELIRENKRLPPSGYRSHGMQAPIRLVVFCGAEGPVLQARPEDRAGTIYYAVNEDASRYWISMVGLTEFPAGKPGILRGPGNEPIVLVPESRLSTEAE